MRQGTLTNRAPILGATLALVLAACSPAADAGAGDDLTLSIATPADGAEVSVPFDITVESNVEIGPPETGNHHVHFYFDTDISSPDYQLVYANSETVDRELAPGEHTIIASLRNADHSDAGPMQEITVTVAGDGEGGEGDASESEPSSAPPELPPGGDY